MSYFLVVWGGNEPTITPDAGVYFEPLACCGPFVQQCVRYLVGYVGSHLTTSLDLSPAPLRVRKRIPPCPQGKQAGCRNDLCMAAFKPWLR